MTNIDEALEVVAEGEEVRIRERLEAEELRQRNAIYVAELRRIEAMEHEAKVNAAIEKGIRIAMYIFLLACSAIFFVGEYMGTIDSFRAGICVGALLMGAIMVATWKKR